MAQSGTILVLLGKKLKRWFWQERRIWLTATGVTSGVVLLKLAGLLQPLELNALDQLFHLRWRESTDSRITIVAINDDDINRIQTWPIPDAVMADLVSRINSYHPRVIGLDIYRNLPVGQGYNDLQQVYSTTPNLIGIEKIAEAKGMGVSPPAALATKEQIGFNNVVVDPDGKVRRTLLFWNTDEGVRRSFALQLALKYLEPSKIGLKSSGAEARLGDVPLHALHPNDGGYADIDTGGYQIFANPRVSNSPFRWVSFADLMAGRVPPDALRDRVVLIGSTAASLRDFFYIADSSLSGSAKPIAGVELQAHFVSQLLSAVLDQRPLLQVWAKPWEWVWILLWATIGTLAGIKARSVKGATLRALLLGSTLVGSCYGVFLLGWWIPLVPPLLALAGSTIVITGHLAHLEEELKKSKEFLHSVINTIPDPVFVKDRHHRWVVLNEAYSRFSGYPLEALLEKTDYDFFTAQQAAQFWEQDDLTFTTGIGRESEEIFTDARGTTYLIATKRSLHRDAAGNLFLVGVIRDITQRKRMEEELRRTAAELERSNEELQQAKANLTHLAYHDSLTGLPNRKLLQEHLVKSLDWAANHNQYVAVLFLDLDGFKLVNDTSGHQTGDALLRSVAHRLTTCLRSSDVVARLGGDEFVVLLPSIANLLDIKTVAEKILTTLEQPFVLADKSFSISASIGISVYPINSDSAEDLVKQADAAMYHSKEAGKSCYSFFHKECPEQSKYISSYVTEQGG